MASGENDEREILSTGEVAALLAPYGVRLDDQQLSAIAAYTHLLIKWNQSVNLTAIEDPQEIIARHFGESIFAASVISGISGRLADAGTGAGFPGMPLKIAIPSIQLLLIEPNNKKCAFLTEAKRSLGLRDVELFRGRYEDTHGPGRELDFVCSRALGGYRELLRWARTALAPHGRVILWLGADDSLALSKTPGWTWQLPIPIPQSQRRLIQVGTPNL